MFKLTMAWPTQVLVALVRAYRYWLSPWLGSSCRFEPTCSAYAIGALQVHGAIAGSYLTLHRVCRCHPWCPGGLDEVPPRPFSLFQTKGIRRSGRVGAQSSTSSYEPNP